MNAKIKWIVLFFLAALLMGCSTNEKSDQLINYQRSGGLTGLSDQLVIDKNGNATLERKGNKSEFTVDAKTFEQIKSIFEQSDFATMQAEYLPAQQGADLIDYQITYNAHTVHAVDTAIPDSLQPVLNALNQIIENTNTP